VTTLIDPDKLKQILEAALMAADEPLSVDQLTRLFAHHELDSEEGRAQIRDTLAVLEAEAQGRGYELKRVASGYRYQVRQELSEWVSRLWEEKPPRYSRALLETLAESDPLSSVLLSVRLLAVDAALKRFDPLWWDGAERHETEGED